MAKNLALYIGVGGDIRWDVGDVVDVGVEGAGGDVGDVGYDVGDVGYDVGDVEGVEGVGYDVGDVGDVGCYVGCDVVVDVGDVGCDVVVVTCHSW